MSIPNVALQVILLVAIGLLIASLRPILHIHAMLQPGHLRQVWSALALLILFVVGGYALFLRINIREGPNHHEDDLISLVFLAAAVFAYMVCIVSEQTTKDVGRIAELETAVRVDTLTGLFSRAHIVSLLEAECSFATRHTAPVSIILLDIDGFKSVNDRFGHLVGDAVLAELATAIRLAAPRPNSVGRYGGEELLILAPGATPVAAMQLAESIRARVEATVVSLASGANLTLSASLGVATSLTFREQAADLIAGADRALYTAKRSGRNRVCPALEMPGQLSWRHPSEL